MENSDDGWMDQDIISMRLKLGTRRWIPILVEPNYLMKIGDELRVERLVFRINLSEIKKLQPACSSVVMNCVSIYKKGLAPYRNQTLMPTIKL